MKARRRYRRLKPEERRRRLVAREERAELRRAAERAAAAVGPLAPMPMTNAEITDLVERVRNSQDGLIEPLRLTETMRARRNRQRRERNARRKGEAGSAHP